jgi:hypothetical protein
VTVDPDEHLDPLALVYRPVSSGTPSNSARHRAVGALESVVAKWSKGEYASLPTFTPHFAEYNQRNATFHDDHASLSTVDGRVIVEYVIPEVTLLRMSAEQQVGDCWCDTPLSSWRFLSPRPNKDGVYSSSV